MPRPDTGSWGDRGRSSGAWRRLRKLILERDHGICYVCGGEGADEVDHVDGNRDNHHPDNLRAIHDQPCHRHKSSMEGHAAKAAQRAARRRPTEAHPGVR